MQQKLDTIARSYLQMNLNYDLGYDMTGQSCSCKQKGKGLENEFLNLIENNQQEDR